MAAGSAGTEVPLGFILNGMGTVMAAKIARRVRLWIAIFLCYARSDNGHLNAPRAAPITTLSWRLRVTPLSHRAAESSLLPLLLHNTADTSAAEASSFSGNVTADGHSATDSPK